jgi:CHAD domain-containing protein
MRQSTSDAERTEFEHHVHQARVATRRLRAALRLFENSLPEDAQALRDELRWSANQFSSVRDLDVQLARLHMHARRLDAQASLQPYAAWLGAERQRALRPLCEALDSPRFAALQRRLDATQQWSAANATLSPAEHITGAIRRLKKAHADLHDPPSPAELHRLRIRAKRARYTVEFFEDLYAGRASRLRERLVALQDLLGGFQDGVVSRERIAQSGATWPAATLLALGRLQQHELQLGQEAVKRLPRRYKDAGSAWKRFDESSVAIP